MAKDRLVYLISGFRNGRDIPFEWIAQSAVSQEFDLEFILLNDGPGEFEDHMRRAGAKVRRIPYRGKRDLPLATIWLFMHFLRCRVRIVHAHLFGACAAGLLAAWLARVPKRLYTRHHSTINHERFPRAVIYDRLFNWLSTHIIATCENGREVLRSMENVSDRKIRVVNFGFKLEEFFLVTESRVARLREKYNLKGKAPIIGVIAKYIEWKGVQYVAEGWREILERYPDACLVIANAAETPHRATVLAALQKCGRTDSWREVVFEEDFMALYKLFDVFVHVPVDAKAEAFGQIYVEALASGTPAVFTLSGIANEFIVHEKNALVVGYRDSSAIANAVSRILGDKALANRLTDGGKESVRERFTHQRMVKKLLSVYRE